MRSFVDSPWTVPAVVLVVLAAGAGLLAASYGWSSVSAFWSGSFGSWYGFTSGTLVRAVPLMLTGLGVALAFRAGVFNIGADGQLLAGAAVATYVGLQWSALLGHTALPVALFAGAVAGAAWAGIAAVLRSRFGVLEVISTLMLNFVAADLVAFLVRGPLQEPLHIYPQSASLPAGMSFCMGSIYRKPDSWRLDWIFCKIYEAHLAAPSSISSSMPARCGFARNACAIILRSMRWCRSPGRNFSPGRLSPVRCCCRLPLPHGSAKGRCLPGSAPIFPPANGRNRPAPHRSCRSVAISGCFCAGMPPLPRCTHSPRLNPNAVRRFSIYSPPPSPKP
ncbi:MAG: hypothetical protein B7Z72_06205 [Gemmatimonadetes bacterium 21-71-4]|nr:MAG: hypothetical protein B7Z72_06205 [Gemmatimonadetes bacterium 21-71-4]